MMIRLNMNNIESVEGFHRIYLPKLKFLSLSTFTYNQDENNINKLTDSRKASWQNLETIQFDKDWIKKRITG